MKTEISWYDFPSSHEWKARIRKPAHMTGPDILLRRAVLKHCLIDSSDEGNSSDEDRYLMV